MVQFNKIVVQEKNKVSCKAHFEKDKIRFLYKEKYKEYNPFYSFGTNK